MGSPGPDAVLGRSGGSTNTEAVARIYVLANTNAVQCLAKFANQAFPRYGLPILEAE